MGIRSYFVIIISKHNIAVHRLNAFKKDCRGKTKGIE
jgi:hypothetical protein